MANTVEMTAKEMPKKPRKLHESFFASVYADIVGIGAVVATALGAGWVMTNAAFFKNADKDTAFEGIRVKRKDARKAAHDNHLTGEELIGALGTAETDYAKAIRAKTSELKIKGPFQKWRTLASHQKTEITFTMVAVSAAAIGIIASLVGNRQSFAKQQDLADQLDAAEAIRKAENRAL